MKVSMITDHLGIPNGMCCHPGNRPDVVLLEDSLKSSLENLQGMCLFADRGYDSKNNRRICHEYGLHDRIFRKRTKSTKRSNAKRICVEHTFAWMKMYRRLRCMYEHTPEQFISFLYMAFGHIIWTRTSE